MARLSDPVKTIIAEAVGDGEAGMFGVASVIVNRARERGLTLDQVVNQPHQFSGRFRPDLDEFIAAQPKESVEKAKQALTKAQADPMPGVNHFLTTELFESKRRPFWANQMQLRGVIGNHVFLEGR